MVFRRIIENSVIRRGGRSLIKDQSVHSYVVVFNVLINRSFDERVFFFFFFFFKSETFQCRRLLVRESCIYGGKMTKDRGGLFLRVSHVARQIP